jgi:hypothetical protein
MLTGDDGCDGGVTTTQAWQDDEWQVQQNHRDLGVAVGKVTHAER